MPPLRPFQSEALSALARHPHVLAIAPPGSGKSRIFQEFLVKNRHAVAWIVTPLVALGRQHQRDLTRLGLDKRSEILSPEAMARPDFRPGIQNPDLLVVDECHCLWEWGDRFRPAFSHLPTIARRMRSLWLSATLPAHARDELAAALPSLHQVGRYTPQPTLDLGLIKVPWLERPAFAANWIRLQEGPGIVFVLTRTEAGRVARLLTSASIEASVYHAGLSLEEKLALEKQLASATRRVVLVATVAFGLGMNLTNLRWSLVWQALPSVLAMVQAAGRVGRTSRVDRGVILWHPDDLKPLEFIAQSPRARHEVQNVFQFFESEGCIHIRLTEYFERYRPPPCGSCLGCRGQNARNLVDHRAIRA